MRITLRRMIWTGHVAHTQEKFLRLYRLRHCFHWCYPLCNTCNKNVRKYNCICYIPSRILLSDILHFSVIRNLSCPSVPLISLYSLMFLFLFCTPYSLTFFFFRYFTLHRTPFHSFFMSWKVNPISFFFVSRRYSSLSCDVNTHSNSSHTLTLS